MFRSAGALIPAVLAALVMLTSFGCGGKSSMITGSGDRFRLLPGLAKGPGDSSLPASFKAKVESDPFPTAAQRGLVGQ